MVQVNGEKYAVDGVCLADFLIAHGYDHTRIAVEKNGEIVPKATYADTILKDGDCLEVVSFVGGG